MRSNARPFVLHSHTPLVEIKNVLNTSVHYPHYWSHDFIDLLQKVCIIMCATPVISVIESPFPDTAALCPPWSTNKHTTGVAPDATTSADELSSSAREKNQTDF